MGPRCERSMAQPLATTPSGVDRTASRLPTGVACTSTLRQPISGLVWLASSIAYAHTRCVPPEVGTSIWNPRFGPAPATAEATSGRDWSATPRLAILPSMYTSTAVGPDEVGSHAQPRATTPPGIGDALSRLPTGLFRIS